MQTQEKQNKTNRTNEAERGYYNLKRLEERYREGKNSMRHTQPSQSTCDNREQKRKKGYATTKLKKSSKRGMRRRGEQNW